jgi:alpha-ribazole phosphatase
MILSVRNNKRIYLVRHGDIDQGRNKRYIGQSDIKLSSLGLEQADFLKQSFKVIPLNNIYCSDLSRARQTAEIIAAPHAIVPTTLAELRELNMGEWEGKLFSEIKSNYPKEFRERGEDIANYASPKGESFLDCSQRVIPIFERFSQSDENTILIVGHAGMNRVILCHILGLPLDNVFRLEQNYGCVNLIYCQGSEYRLKYLNRTIYFGL